MFLGLYQATAILIVIISFYMMDFILMRRYDRQRQASGSGRSWDFTLLIMGACILLVVQPIWLPWLGLSTLEWWGLAIQILGIIIIVSALCLHAWARLHLGHFYAERVEILPNHKVIDTGPYASIRHPVITSFFGLAIGLFLINPAITTLLMAVYAFWDFGRAARQEEKLLAKNLPEYTTYMQRTSRFLPCPWRKH